MHRPSRRVSAVIVAATCLLAAGVLTAAQAVQPVNHPKAGTGTSSLSLPPAPLPNQIPLGLTIDRGVQSVKRAKLAFNIRPFRGLAWVVVTSEPPDPEGNRWSDGTASVYVTNPGTKDQFGEFAPVDVKMLAFGSIPVSATVHITQVQDGRWPKPFTLTVRFTAGFPIKNPPSSLPCAPSNCSYTDPPHLSGLVNVRVDNVKVDEVPVDVGPNCETATPATMSLTAAAGYYSLSSPPFIQPGLYLPFYFGGILHGTVNVPAFTGCRNGADDLSSVITAMVSGPGNELATRQDGPLVNYPPPPPPKK